ncbi:hypothetical protein ACFLRQ_03735, partial [Bacteroidota bacterium]
DDDNLYGDGSGMVNFTGTADNAFTTNYDFGDGSSIEVAPDGNISHVFSITGVKMYNVTLRAVGTGGLSSSKTIAIEVFSSFSDSVAIRYLTGGDSKSWYWAADQSGHISLGPNFLTADDEQNTHTWAYYWVGAPFEKSATTMYESEFIFAMDGENVTFEHKNASGKAFFQGDNLDIVGGAAEGDYEYDFSGVKNVSFGPASTIATIDGDYRGTMMNIGDGGFMGFYVGSSSYEIISINESQLKLRVESAGQPEHAWYHTFTDTKPVQ